MCIYLVLDACLSETVMLDVRFLNKWCISFLTLFCLSFNFHARKNSNITVHAQCTWIFGNFYTDFSFIHSIFYSLLPESILWNKIKHVYCTTKKSTYIFKQAWKCGYYNWNVNCNVINKFDERVTRKKNTTIVMKMYIDTHDYCVLISTVLLWIANIFSHKIISSFRFVQIMGWLEFYLIHVDVCKILPRQGCKLWHIYAQIKIDYIAPEKARATTSNLLRFVLENNKLVRSESWSVRMIHCWLS